MFSIYLQCSSATISCTSHGLIHQTPRINLEGGYYHYSHFTDVVAEYTDRQGFPMSLHHINPSVLLIVVHVNGALWSCAGHKPCSQFVVTYLRSQW